MVGGLILCTCGSGEPDLGCGTSPLPSCRWKMRLTISGTPTAGSFTVTLNAATTPPLAYNASIGTIRNALAALPAVFRTFAGSPATGQLSATTVTSTSTLKVYEFTFDSSPQTGFTPISAVNGGLLIGATIAITQPLSPVLAATGKTAGRYKLAFSGVGMPSTVTASAVPFYTSSTVAPQAGNAPIWQAYTLPQRATYDTFGAVPTTTYFAAIDGFHFLRDSYNREIRLVHPSIGDWVNGNLQRFPCAGSFSAYNPGIRKTPQGPRYGPESPADVWPFAQARTPGIDRMMTTVQQWVQFGIVSGPGGGNYARLIITAASNTKYRTNDVYPTYSGPPFAKTCENFSAGTIANACVFDGTVLINAGESFPCSRSTWTFTNDQTAGNAVPDRGNYFAITTGGTVTMTAEAAPAFGDDAPDEYTLSMEVGQPKSASGTGTSPFGPLSEAVEITLKRYPIAFYDQDASNLRRLAVGYEPVWFGETLDGLFRASLCGSVSTSGSNAYLSRLVVERQLPYLNADGSVREGGRQLRFESLIEPGVDLRPPDNTPAHPRYDLVSAKPRGAPCATTDPTQPVDEMFGYTFPLLEAGTTTLNYPVRPYGAFGCPKTYRVAWKEVDAGLSDGSTTIDVQVLDVDDEIPDEYESEVVRREPCLCYTYWMPFCPHRYANKWNGEETVDAGEPGYRYVQLSPSTRAGSFGAVPFLTPPVWIVQIFIVCPRQTTVIADGAASQTSECPTTGVYNVRKCIGVSGIDCTECVGGTCAKVDNTIRVAINIAESALESWAERHPESSEPPALIFDVTRTAGCLWKAASAGVNTGMTTKAVRCEFERVDNGAGGLVWEIRVYRPPEGEAEGEGEGEGGADVLVFSARIGCTAFQSPDRSLEGFLVDVGQTLYQDGQEDYDGDGLPDNLANTPLEAFTS